MAMAGIGIERDIGDEAEIWHLALDRAASAADEIVGIERLARLLIPLARLGKGKQRECRNAKLRRLGRGPHGLVDGEALDARHGGNGLPRVFALAKEDWPDEIVRGQGVFADEPACPVRLAVAPQTLGKIESWRGGGGGVMLRRGLALWALRQRPDHAKLRFKGYDSWHGPHRHGISAGGDNMSRALAIVAGACPLLAAKERSRDSSEAR